MYFQHGQSSPGLAHLQLIDVAVAVVLFCVWKEYADSASIIALTVVTGFETIFVAPDKNGTRPLPEAILLMQRFKQGHHRVLHKEVLRQNSCIAACLLCSVKSVWVVLLQAYVNCAPDKETNGVLTFAEDAYSVYINQQTDMIDDMSGEHVTFGLSNSH